MHDDAPRRLDRHEPRAYSGVGMGHALLWKRQDVAVAALLAAGTDVLASTGAALTLQQGQPHGERRPVPFGRRDRDAAPVRRDQLLTDEQPQAQAALRGAIGARPDRSA